MFIEQGRKAAQAPAERQLTNAAPLELGVKCAARAINIWLLRSPKWPFQGNGPDSHPKNVGNDKG